MGHPIEELLADLYQRFGQGDLEGVLSLCTDDIIFEVPGSAPFSGRYTKATFPQLVQRVTEISRGTFGERPIQIIGNDDHAVALLDHWFERKGARVEYRTDHIWGVRDGRFSSWLERPGNQDEFDRVWRT
jgi:ketosteroid isomerase-like protein